jgi:Fe-Mn family superoxide dismutase
MEEVIRLSHDKGDKKAFNNAGQSWNHAFFWRAIGADGARRPQGALGAAIDKAFGGFDAFADKFKAEGVGHFGSGWAWLVSDASGALSLTSTHDADPVFLAGKTAILVCDVWEHAYYIDHRNNRGGFLEGYIKTRANWDFAEKQYTAATSGQFGWTYA